MWVAGTRKSSHAKKTGVGAQEYSIVTSTSLDRKDVRDRSALYAAIRDKSGRWLLESMATRFGDKLQAWKRIL